MSQCLICQSGEDTAALLRIPVSLEGTSLGDFVVCSGCIDLLGRDKVAELVRAAALTGVRQAGGLAPVTPNSDAETDELETAHAGEAPRTLEAELPATALANEPAFAGWLGQQLAPLLLGQYRRGRGQVTVLTSLTQDGEGYRFRAVLGD